MNCNEEMYPILNGKNSLIDPTSIRPNPNIDYLEIDYATCTSSGLLLTDEYNVNKKFSSRNYRRPRTHQMTKNKIPIDQFYRSSTSSFYRCKDIKNISIGASKQFNSSPPEFPTLQSSYWSKIKQRELSQKLYEDKSKIDTRPSFIYSTKLCEKNILPEVISSETKITYNDDAIKSLNTEKKNNSTVNNKFSTPNELNIQSTNVNMKPEKIEIYYFDHGNSGYYLTTDIIPILLSDKCADKIDSAATKFWAEIFGTIHIGMTFIIAFILQLLRFIFRSVIRSLIVGIIQMTADYIFKPILSIIYNGIIQPILIFLYNIATSFRDLCEPIAEAMGYFIHQFSNLFRTIRLIEVNPQSLTNNNHPSINQST